MNSPCLMHTNTLLVFLHNYCDILTDLTKNIQSLWCWQNKNTISYKQHNNYSTLQKAWTPSCLPRASSSWHWLSSCSSPPYLSSFILSIACLDTSQNNPDNILLAIWGCEWAKIGEVVHVNAKGQDLLQVHLLWSVGESLQSSQSPDYVLLNQLWAWWTLRPRTALSCMTASAQS